LTEFVAGSGLRKLILRHLWAGPKTPTELASLESKHVSHVSRALRELSVRGVVEPMVGPSRERYYRMTTTGYIVLATILRIR